jgi:hypothetical protein
MLSKDFKEFAELLHSNAVEYRRIDLLTSIDGVEFGACYARRFDVEVDGIQLHFIALEDFKRNKRAVGRHQDLADLESLGESGEPENP